MEGYEFNQHNLWLYIHGDPTDDMTLSGVEYNFIKGDPTARSYDRQHDQFFLFVPVSWLEDFVAFVPETAFEDSAIEGHIKRNHVAIDIVDLCEWFEIDYKQLLTEKDRASNGFVTETTQS